MLHIRYYGKSHPTPDLSVKNLVWLSSRQALADLATFITSITRTHQLSGAWVALGGSYPGSLAAWLRLKYPHLVAAAVSTSAPLLAKVDFFEYLEVVEQSLNTVPGCVESVKTAISDVEKLVLDRSWSMLTDWFRLCSQFDGDNNNDVINLFESLIGNFEGVVQYNKDNRAFEGFQWQNVTIDTVCNIMTSDEVGGSALERLARVNDISLAMEGQKCLDHTYKSEVIIIDP